MSTATFRKSPLFRYIALTVLTAFAGLLPATPSYAQVSIIMPPPGQMIHITNHFEPPQMVGLKIDLKDPFNFEFIMDRGENPMADDVKKEEFNKIIKYFLVSLAMPNKDMWVNLSPYESTRLIPEVFAQTEMGRDLLAQDYLLKQFTASLMYPENGLGKKFWDKVYREAQARFGTTEINVNTFNKVWIVADHADVYQKDNAAFLVGSHLKVMLEQDYMAITKNKEQFGTDQPVSTDETADAKTKMASDLVRQIIIPAIEKEVNEGQSFAAVRQVYNAEIMATWFKKTLRQSLLGQVFANKGKIAGQRISDPQAEMERIYHEYLRAYKKGVFNYIREDATPDGQTIPRKYFSGGALGVNSAMVTTLTPSIIASSPAAAAEVGKWKKLAIWAIGQSRYDSVATQLNALKGNVLMKLGRGASVNPANAAPVNPVAVNPAPVNTRDILAQMQQAQDNLSLQNDSRQRAQEELESAQRNTNSFRAGVGGVTISDADLLNNNNVAFKDALEKERVLKENVDRFQAEVTRLQGQVATLRGQLAGVVTPEAAQSELTDVLQQIAAKEREFKDLNETDLSGVEDRYRQQVAEQIGEAETSLKALRARHADLTVTLKALGVTPPVVTPIAETPVAPVTTLLPKLDAINQDILTNDQELRRNQGIINGENNAEPQHLVQYQDEVNRLTDVVNGLQRQKTALIAQIITSHATERASVEQGIKDLKASMDNYAADKVGDTAYQGLKTQYSLLQNQSESLRNVEPRVNQLAIETNIGSVLTKERALLKEKEAKQAIVGEAANYTITQRQELGLGVNSAQERDWQVAEEIDAIKAGKLPTDVERKTPAYETAMKEKAQVVYNDRVAIENRGQRFDEALYIQDKTGTGQNVAEIRRLRAEVTKLEGFSNNLTAINDAQQKINAAQERAAALNRQLKERADSVIAEREQLRNEISGLRNPTAARPLDDQITSIAAAINARNGNTDASTEAKVRQYYGEAKQQEAEFNTKGMYSDKSPEVEALFSGKEANSLESKLASLVNERPPTPAQKGQMTRIRNTQSDLKEQLEAERAKLREIADLVKERAADRALATSRPAFIDHNVGGINLSDENLTINIKVDGNGMPLPAIYQDKAMLNFNGLTSVIRSITPLTPENLPPALNAMLNQ